MEICVIDADRDVAPFLRIEGHPDSEIAGVAFSPDRRRLYFSSQRGPTDVRLQDLMPGVTDERPVGMVFEVEGPFLSEQMQTARIVGRAQEGNGSQSPAPYLAAGGSLVVAGLVGALLVRRRRTTT